LSIYGLKAYHEGDEHPACTLYLYIDVPAVSFFPVTEDDSSRALRLAYPGFQRQTSAKQN